MQRFIDKWYGDRCPPWTWPLTAFLIGSGIVVAAHLF